jgi:hypothetical protein
MSHAVSPTVSRYPGGAFSNIDRESPSSLRRFEM